MTNKSKQYCIVGASIVAIVVIFVFALLAEKYMKEELEYLSTEWPRNIIISIGAVIGLYIAYYRTDAMQKQAGIAEKRYASEQFAQGVTLLAKDNQEGTPAIEARIGGVYALAQLAKADPKQYGVQVMKALVAYIRNNAQRTALSVPSKEDEDTLGTVPEEHSEAAYLGEDVKTAFAELKRLHSNPDVRKDSGVNDEDLSFSHADFHALRLNEVEWIKKPDLSYANLSGANLSSANLQGANLSLAKLPCANLKSAKLKDADLWWADLKDARLQSADLKYAGLRNADLKDAELQEANLQGANLWNAKLQGADLLKANLQGADLEYAELQGANLEYAELQGANLEYAYLKDAELQEANLQGANLKHAELQGAILHGAELQGANLLKANLQGANLEHADLKDAKLQEANLQGANLEHAGLQGANLEHAGLQGANLEYAYLKDAELQEANLQGANLKHAELQGAILHGAELQGADLNGAKLQKVGLRKTDLQGANFQGTKLQGAILQDANLQGADLRWADLRGADFTRAKAIYTAFEEAIFDKSTVFDDSAKEWKVWHDDNPLLLKREVQPLPLDAEWDLDFLEEMGIRDIGFILEGILHNFAEEGYNKPGPRAINCRKAVKQWVEEHDLREKLSDYWKDWLESLDSNGYAPSDKGYAPDDPHIPAKKS